MNIATSHSYLLSLDYSTNSNPETMSTTTYPPVVPISSMAHQIPFRQPAVTVPLSWTFGGTGSTTTNTPHLPNPITTTNSVYHHPILNLVRRDQPPPPSPSSKSSRKRAASDEIHPEHHHPLRPSSPPHLKSLASLPKRTKKSIHHLSGHSEHPIDPSQNKADETDLGTALVSLTKIELLTLLHGLIQQQPDLKPTIKSLLPPPSLESILMRLEEVEKHLIESIPNKRMNREEYIWNRVRIPLNTYVNDCMSWLEASSQTIESRCTVQDGKIELSDIYRAVSDQLSFLSRMSLSVSRVESHLPNLNGPPSSHHESFDQDLNWNVSYPLQSILIPSIFQNWKNFIETIHRLIFIDRMIISESLIRKWFNLLDELSSSSNQDDLDSNPFFNPSHAAAPPSTETLNRTVQRLMIAVRDEAQNRFGCLIGFKR